MSTADLVLSIISMVGASILVGVSAAFAWFRSSKAVLSERMDQLDCDMRADAEKYATWHAEHGMKVHGLEIHQSTTKEALKEIQDLAHKTSRSVERLLQAIVSNG